MNIYSLYVFMLHIEYIRRILYIVFISIYFYYDFHSKNSPSFYLLEVIIYFHFRLFLCSLKYSVRASVVMEKSSGVCTVEYYFAAGWRLRNGQRL